MANLTANVGVQSAVDANKTRNFVGRGGTNEIFFGAALMWDTTNDVVIRNAAGANKFCGIAIQQLDEDDKNIMVLNEGEIKVASIAGTPEVGVKVYLNDTDNVWDDLTTTSAGHTCVGYIVDKEGTNWIVRLTPAAGIA